MFDFEVRCLHVKRLFRLGCLTFFLFFMIIIFLMRSLVQSKAQPQHRIQEKNATKKTILDSMVSQDFCPTHKLRQNLFILVLFKNVKLSV